MSDKLLGLIRIRHWEKLVEHSNPALVLEFYANAYKHQNIFVSGNMVPFDRSTINRYYDLLDIDKDGYHSLLETQINWDQIL